MFSIVADEVSVKVGFEKDPAFTGFIGRDVAGFGPLTQGFRTHFQQSRRLTQVIGVH
jgi:hypothetical protein